MYKKKLKRVSKEWKEAVKTVFSLKVTEGKRIMESPLVELCERYEIEQDDLKYLEFCWRGMNAILAGKSDAVKAIDWADENEKVYFYQLGEVVAFIKGDEILKRKLRAKKEQLNITEKKQGQKNLF